MLVAINDGRLSSVWLRVRRGLVGMFRNMTPIVAPVAAINNELLPIWMIGFGIILLQYRDNHRTLTK